jgi:quercetin dioxygenase-like cupin family protein
MTTVNVTEIELNEFIGKEDKEQHCKATFPLVGAHGSKKLATVYFELEPGDHLGRHTDSAEELLVILDGQVEALVGTEKQKAAKVLGVFGGANNIVATFDNEMLPTESNVVDTSLLFS